MIERQHQEMLELYHSQTDIKRSIDNFEYHVAYRDTWIGFRYTYPLLERFAGGMENIFTWKSLVESDFSVVKYEKNKKRMRLTDVSLEGILHAKQKHRMHNLQL